MMYQMVQNNVGKYFEIIDFVKRMCINTRVVVSWSTCYVEQNIIVIHYLLNNK